MGSNCPIYSRPGTVARSAVWLARTGGRPDEQVMRILLYHRVADDGDPLAVPPRRFRDQMDRLASEGFSVVGLLEALELLDSGSLAPRTVGLTFDDGFADLRDEALPVLAKHGFRATVFIATGVTDGRLSFPWYERQPRVLGWDDVLELDRAARCASRLTPLASQPALRRRRDGGCRDRELPARDPRSASTARLERGRPRQASAASPSSSSPCSVTTTTPHAQRSRVEA